MKQNMDLTAFDNLFTDEGDVIETGAYKFHQYEFNPLDFIRRAVIWYGATASGKSFHLRNVLYNVRHHFARVIVFCPTAANNHDYEDKVPNCLIHTELDEDTFLKMVDAQQRIADVYETRVQNLKYLREAFAHCATDKQREQLTTLDQTFNELSKRIMITKEPDNIKAKRVKDIKDQCDAELREFMKAVITVARNSIKIEQLSEAAQETVKYIDMNPHTLIIFDDCQNELSRLMKKKSSAACKALEDFCTRGRHIYMTQYYTCQNDTSFPPPIRQGAHVSILTQVGVASGFMGRDTSGLTSDLKRMGNALVGQLFQGKHDHRKIIYFRENDDEFKFQYHTAEESGMFCTCSNLINKFCESIAREV